MIKVVTFFFVLASFISCMEPKLKTNKSPQEQNLSKDVSNSDNIASFTINNGQSLTKEKNVLITIRGKNISSFVLTQDQISCNTGSWQSFNSQYSSLILNNSNALNTIYMKFRFTDQEETICSSQRIIHDDVPPSDVTTFVKTLDSIPRFTFSTATDANGIKGYELQIGKFHLCKI